MPRSAVMSHPVTPTTRANTRSKTVKRDLPPTTASATNTNTEDSPSATVAATVSFATPDRADGVTIGGEDGAISASTGAGTGAGGTTTRTRSGRSLSSDPSGSSVGSGDKDMATPVAAPTPKAAATVTPPDDKINNAPTSSSIAGAGPTITDQEQPPAVAPGGAGGSAPATTKSASPPIASAKAAGVVDPGESPLSPGAKRFGLRKRKPKSPSPVGAEDYLQGTSDGRPASSNDGEHAPRSPRPSPAAAAAAAAAAAVTSATIGVPATASRNVTFSPVPPQQHHYAGGSTAAGGAGGRARPLPTLQEGEPATTSTMLLPPDSPGGEKKKKGGGGTAGAKPSSKDKGGETASGAAKDRGGRATPTNFATDFGKSINSPSFQTGEGVFSWLQSPTHMFSPGGYAPSAVNTPREYYGAGPRTPRTPNDRAGFFFSDVAGLPPGAEGYSPRISGRRQPQHPLSNLICVSPLATNKSKPGTPINYKNIFDSPPGRHPTTGTGGRAAPYMGSRSGKKGKKPADATTLEAVHMAERDLMEDEDLSVLLQLASAATPRGHPAHPAHARYGHMAGEAPSNLQLPVIGKGGPTHASGSPSKLVARKDAPGGAARHPGQSRHTEHFRPPALPSGSGPGSKGGASAAKGSTKGEKKTPSPTNGEQGSRPAGPGGEYMHGYHPFHPGAHPAFMGHHPMGPGGWKPGAGPPPPHARGPPPYGVPPPGSGTKEKGQGAPHRHMYHPNFPPHMAYHMMHFPPQPNARHPMNAAAYPPPPKNTKEGTSSKGKGSGSGKSSGSNSPSSHAPSKSSPKATPKAKEKSKEKSKTSAATAAAKRKSASGGQPAPAAAKKSKPSSPKKKSKSARKTASHTSGSGNGGGSASLADRQKTTKSAAAISAIAGGKNKEAAALAAAILRGVTMRPSGKWQAQMYFAGKSRYIGVFDTREKAALAYEIARAKLQKAKASNNNTEDAVNEARKAAFDGVNEKDPRRK